MLSWEKAAVNTDIQLFVMRPGSGSRRFLQRDVVSSQQGECEWMNG